MSRSKLLEGLKVIDITIVIAGPTVTYLLVDMGADVIKVEHPVRGDDARHFMPQKNGICSSFIWMNRGKKGLAVDLNKPEGQEIIKELAKQSDVLVENFTPGTMKRWGIDYETLSRINPGLIMVSVSGFGQTGPMSHLPGYDIVGQAMSGIMSVTGHPGGPPTRVGVLIGDTSSGAFGCIGLLAALYNREKTGLGQHVDISMQDVLISYYDLPTYTWEGKLLGRTGNRVPTIAPFDSYPTKDDRWVIIPAANNKLWEQLCEIMGRPELATDPRFADNPGRCKNYDELSEEISKWSSQHTLNEIIGLLQARGNPVSPILNIDEVLAMPHVKERGIVVDIDDPIAGRVSTANIPIKFSRTPASISGPAPMLGEHTREILSSLGYPEENINKLAQDGVIKVI
ncbi:MAG: CoA transferase [Firmicutes bacterium]|nr:CoA transferase [Bacillota bacterium]